MFITENRKTLFECKPEASPSFLHTNVNILKKQFKKRTAGRCIEFGELTEHVKKRVDKKSWVNRVSIMTQQYFQPLIEDFEDTHKKLFEETQPGTKKLLQGTMDRN